MSGSLPGHIKIFKIYVSANHMKKYYEKLLNLLSSGIAIDLGTANTKIYFEKKGVIFQEPTVIAINEKTGQIIAVGEEAKEMVGKTPAHISARRPLRDGVISDYEAAEEILKYFIRKAKVKRLVGPRSILTVPSGLTEVEKKAVLDAAKGGGAREVGLVEQAMAAAIGAQLPVEEPEGILIVDIGGGTTEIAVISLGGIVLVKSLKIGGDKLNQAIVRYIYERFKILIGEKTAERAKISIANVWKENKKEKKEFLIRGRNIVTGLPTEMTIDSKIVTEAIDKEIKLLINELKMVIEKTPPELISDIMRSGIYLCGGGALLKGLDLVIKKETKIETQIIDEPQFAVVKGGGVILENFKKYRDILIEPSQLEAPKL